VLLAANQAASGADQSEANTDKAATNSTQANASAASGGPQKTSFLSQHISFQTLDGSMRYLYADQAEHKVTSRTLQYKISTRLQVNLDRCGNSYFQARGETGTAYNLSWNSTGVGLNPPADRFNVKTFFYGQKIGSHFEAQVGGLEYDWGAGTEATYSDYDGFFEGYRLRYSMPANRWLPEKIDVTAGYLGDFAQLNVFSRLHRLADNNYWQVLAQKKLREHAEASVEYDWLEGIHYTREALHWQKLPLRVIDDMEAEVITRLSDDASFGGALTLTKSVDHLSHWKFGGLFVNMPQRIFMNGTGTVLINADMYGVGQHIGPIVRVSPIKDFEVTIIGFHRLDSTPGVRNRAYVGVRYQFSGLANRLLRART